MKKIILFIFAILFSSAGYATSIQSDLDKVLQMSAQVHALECDFEILTEEFFQPKEYQVSIDESIEKVFEIPCTRGAYNFGSVFFYKSKFDGQISPITFAEPAFEVEYADELYEQFESISKVGFRTTSVLINPNFDPSTGVITSFSKWRGLGDAYDSGTWKLINGSFVLKQYVVDPTYNDDDGAQTIVDYK